LRADADRGRWNTGAANGVAALRGVPGKPPFIAADPPRRSPIAVHLALKNVECQADRGR
jgi:hypothetical protein